MSLVSRIARFSHVLATPWIFTWVLILPFFHIHIIDTQEDLSQNQGFLPHTVFSADLAGEYAPRAHADQRGMPGHQRALSTHFLQYSEMAIGLFSEDTDAKRKLGISPLHHAHFVSPRRPPVSLVQSVISELPSPPLLLLTSSDSSRAPPVCLL